MSGGSWDYFYRKASRLNAEAYEEMAAALADYPEAAARVLRAAELLKEARAIHEEMADVMQAVEWRDSGDWDDDAIAQCVAEWGRRPTP